MQVYTGLNNQTQLRCTNCLIELNSESDHKQHYKSEFHRYNIKRKILGLKPASEDQFNLKKGDTNTNAEEANAAGGKGFECKPCRKSFTNDGVYKQHLQSKKHQEQVGKQVNISEKKSRREEVRQIKPELCLFCDIKSNDTTANEKHMEKQHGFFVPQKQFCKDVSGLFLYLHEKVDVGLLCIYCDNKGFKEFQNGTAVRSHMKDKSHCFMNTTNGFEEFEKFYDFGRLFDEKVEDQKNYKYLPGLESDVVEVEVGNKQKKGKVNQILMDLKEEKMDGEEHEEKDEDWEDEDQQQQEWSDVSEDQNNEDQIKEVKQEKRKPKTKKYVMYKPTVMQSGELLLPSGKLLGTRKYRHLYKQYYRPTVLAQNRKMLTGVPFSTELVLKSERLQFFRKQEKQIRTMKLFEKNRDLKLGLQMNNLQYHFRCQTPK